MVYSRRTYYRKRRSYSKGRRTTFKRRRFYRGRGRGRGIARRFNRIYTFSRTGGEIGQVILDGKDVPAQTQGWTFALTNVADYADYTNIFDQFMIYKVVITWRWHSDADELPTSTYPTPVWCACIDYNDTANVSQAAIERSNSYMTKHLSRAMTWTTTIYPRIQVQAYESAVATAYMSKRGYVSTDDPGTPHYGIKWTVNGGQAGGAGTNGVGWISSQVRLFIRFKNCK